MCLETLAAIPAGVLASLGVDYSSAAGGYANGRGFSSGDEGGASQLDTSRFLALPHKRREELAAHFNDGGAERVLARIEQVPLPVDNNPYRIALLAACEKLATRANPTLLGAKGRTPRQIAGELELKDLENAFKEAEQRHQREEQKRAREYPPAEEEHETGDERDGRHGPQRDEDAMAEEGAEP